MATSRGAPRIPWSAERAQLNSTTSQAKLGPIRQGTRTINLNRRNYAFWPTTSTVTEVIPEKKVAFRVNANNTIWSYELEPTEFGTRVVETRHAENGVKAVSNMAVNAMFGGVPSFEQELVAGMNESLTRLKAAGKLTGLVRGLGEIEDAVVVRVVERRPGTGWLRRVRMCAATVFGVDDMAVGGQLVAAHAEHRPE